MGSFSATTVFLIVLALSGCVHSLSSTLQKTINNLNAIVKHIQQPELYSADWANQIELRDTKSISHLVPVASCDIERGDLITLFPIQAISLYPSSDDRNLSSKRINLLQEEKYPYPILRGAGGDNEEITAIYIYSDSSMYPGWLGNIIPTGTDVPPSSQDRNKQPASNHNCAFVPLPGAAPLCGIVATSSIKMGDMIVQQLMDNDDDEDDIINKYADCITKDYAFEIGELMSYLQMAYTEPMHTKYLNSNEAEYHSINESYPNIEKIHSDPDIYTIQDFLSPEECNKIIAKCKIEGNMQPCLIKNEQTGTVEPDPSRTSTNANIPRREVPTVTQKILKLSNCVEDQIEILQVLRYEEGQEFKPHTDGFEGPTSACGFLDSGRIATIFCYLNSVGEGRGGMTSFPKLGLDIQPKQGTCVVHFPMSMDLKEDERTEHQGSIAVDEKWILTTWIWKNWRADCRYSEESLAQLSDGII